jgi:Domain of unknown function (DUF1902)
MTEAEIYSRMAATRSPNFPPLGGASVPDIDHIFTVEMTYLADDGMWMAECDALHLVTEAATYDVLVARTLDIAGELAIENQIMHVNEAMGINFVQRQFNIVTA